MVVLTIIGVIILILGCGFFMLRHNVLEEKHSYHLAFTAKAIASSCFFLLGLICALWCKDAYFKWVTPIALGFGLVGDILLSMSQIKRKGSFFLLGGIAFALEHYIHLMLMVSLKGATFFFGLAFLVLLGLMVIYLVKKYRVEAGKMAVGAACYFVVLLLMCGIAFGTMLLSFTFGSLLFTLGALFFVASDTVLLLNKFGGLRQQRYSNLVMFTYYVAQVLIALSLLAR